MQCLHWHWHPHYDWWLMIVCSVSGISVRSLFQIDIQHWSIVCQHLILFHKYCPHGKMWAWPNFDLHLSRSNMCVHLLIFEHGSSHFNLCFFQSNNLLNFKLEAMDILFLTCLSLWHVCTSSSLKGDSLLIIFSTNNTAYHIRLNDHHSHIFVWKAKGWTGFSAILSIFLMGFLMLSSTMLDGWLEVLKDKPSISVTLHCDKNNKKWS